MNILSSIISPKSGLVMIRKKIEETLGKEVPSFDLMYVAKNDKLQFIIEKEFFSYDSDMLKSAVQLVAKKQAKKNQIIDVVKVSINDKNEVKAVLYYTENNEKNFVTFNL